jgi:hypothetical protein
MVVPWRDLIAVHRRVAGAVGARDLAALYLPPATIVSVDADGDSVLFTGDFRRVDRPCRVRFSPVDPEDARALAQALGARYGLPRLPREVAPHELAQLEKSELVTVVGLRWYRMREMADFEETMLESDKPIPDGRHRITGLLDPNLRTGDEPSRGYHGPYLVVLSCEPAEASIAMSGTFDGARAFEIECEPSGRAWRVLVAGKPVPMTLEETEVTTTNAGRYDKTLRAKARVRGWVTDEPELLTAGAALEMRQTSKGFEAIFRVTTAKAAIYNTVVHIDVAFYLVFPPDLKTVAITVIRSTDTSS